MTRPLIPTLALGLSAVLVTSSAANAAAHVGSPPSATAFPADRVDVWIADTIEDRELVSSWVHEELSKALTEVDLDALPVGRKLVVEISGVNYEWVMSVAATQDGKRMPGSPDASACNCSDEKMLAELASVTRTVIPLLQQELASGGSRTPPIPPRVDPEQPTQPDRTRRPLAGMGKAGIGLLVTGAAGLGVGIGLVAAGTAVDDGNDRQAIDRRPPGYAVIGTSAALAITGAILLGLDRRRARRVQAIVPTWERQFVGISLSGRF